MVTQNDLVTILDHPKVLEDYANNRVFNRDSLIKEIMYAVNIIKGNSYLQSSDAKTVLQCCFNIEAVGLTLNPIVGFAYLVPFSGQCKVMPSYKGLAHLVYKAGKVKAINAQIVYKNDTFRVDLADTIKPITHEVGFGNRGEAIGVYAVATLSNGLKQVEMMEKSELEAIRDMSEDYKRRKAKDTTKDAIWVKHEPEMWRKTVVKRLIKYLPKNESDFEKLSKAVDLDNQAADYDLPVSLSQCQNLDELLRKAELEDGQYYEARLELDSVKTQSQYRILLNKLLKVQPKNIDQQFDDVVGRAK